MCVLDEFPLLHGLGCCCISSQLSFLSSWEPTVLGRAAQESLR